MVLWLHVAGVGFARLLKRTMHHSNSPRTNNEIAVMIGKSTSLWKKIASCRSGVTPGCNPIEPLVG